MTNDKINKMSQLQNTTILIVEDEKKIVDVIRAYLEKENCRVVAAHDGLEAIKILEESLPDLIILDIMLPGLDGIEILKKTRERSNVPVILLTAKSGEVDKIVGLELGADDYLTKPFSPRELIARIKAVLRRKRGEMPSEEEIRAGPLVINLDRHEVLLKGKELSLTATEFGILKALAKSPGRVFTRLQLVDIVQGYSFEGYERTIDAHIKNLRRKIEKTPSTPKIIQTVYGVGYKLEIPNDKD